MNESILSTPKAPMTEPAQNTSKRAFVLTSSDGVTPLCARIPEGLRVGAAIGELAAYAGFAMTDQIETRYALLATTASGDLLLVGDDVTFGEIPEDTVLRIAAQPRPA